MKDLKARAAQAVGLASPALIRPARPGAVYTVNDQAIDFPNSRLPNAGARAIHAKRYVIVVQAAIICTSVEPKTILVAPCSSSFKGLVGSSDFAIPKSEAVFPEETTAFVSLVQPILKMDLKAHEGDLTTETLLRLQAVLLRNLGLASQSAVATPVALASGPASVPVPPEVLLAAAPNDANRDTAAAPDAAQAALPPPSPTKS